MLVKGQLTQILVHYICTNFRMEGQGSPPSKGRRGAAGLYARQAIF